MVVFTTVDGTLRHRDTRSCAEVRAALGLLAGHDIPVVLASDQPADELMWLQSELGFRHPFIADNGATLCTPLGCFPELHGLGERAGDWQVITFEAARDPGQAVRLLISLYRLQQEAIIAIGLGAEWRDRVLLREVDVPVIVRTDAVDQTRLVRRMPNAYFTNAAGPAGWSEAILGSVGE
jgi:predicted mannosyl-3-phosphoglycerate phosphatase (HAD superfamily)